MSGQIRTGRRPGPNPARGRIVLDQGVAAAGLIASLTAETGIEPATADQVAQRLGHLGRRQL
jgi:hypothetical protein